MTHGISAAFLSISGTLTNVPDWFWILLVAHAITTCPTPKNEYLQWLLGIAKWAVGQRISAINVFRGLQTEVTAVTTEQKVALQNGSTMQVVKTTDGILKPLAVDDKPVNLNKS